MARLRQQYSQNYGSSNNINTEFENVVRYLNAAELGEKTVGELLATIFNATGEWIGPIELRKDSSAGLQYRVGTYTDTTSGWVTLATLAELRGETGSSSGTIGAPILHARADIIAVAAQTVFDYVHETADEIIVYVDGVLKREGASYDYQTSASAGSGSAGAVTFNTTPYVSATTTITIYKVRANAVTGYSRVDTLTVSNQAVFPFVHDDDAVLQVYKNGILQRSGGSFDYTSSSSQNAVSFNSIVSSGNLVTIITVENTTTTAVTGLMLEGNFVNTNTGLIDFAKIEIDDNEISQAKVSALATTLTAKANLTTGSSTPTSPATGDLWMDTSQTPNILKFYNGSQWLQTSPDSSLPTITTANASKYVRINGTGTALEYATIDLSSVIATNQRGAANGVASLDSAGLLPASQLPATLATDCYYLKIASPTNATSNFKKIYGQKIQITKISVSTTGGTIDVQPQVNGSAVPDSSTYAANSSGLNSTLGTTIEIDATSTPKTIGFITTNNSSGADLEVIFTYNIMST